ncbi:MAG: ATP-binding protein, partial [Actinomycetota bacterium]
MSKGARFCAYCGTQVATFAEVAERRLVTVAFLDMVGSTPIAEQMDPEEFRDLVLAYQDVCVAAIEGEGGYIADYRGDGILAYFGYPVAHEDDAIRAVRAGLRAVDRVRQKGTELQVRAGMHTGLVVVGEAGAGMRRKHDVVMGDAPNVAARLQSLADAGEVVISQETFELTHGAFVTQDIGTPDLKGISRSIRLYSVVRATPIGTATPHVIKRIIDRLEELAALREPFQLASDGTGQIVMVEGEPGVGKSCLVRALQESLTDADHEWIELAAALTNKLSPLRPVIDVLLDRADLRDDGDDDVQLLRSVAGLPSRDLGHSPVERRRRSMEALRRWFVGRATHRPLVLLVEDLHWLDPTTTELVAAMSEVIASERVLLLVTTRAGESEWPGRTMPTVIGLAPLIPQYATELAATIAAGRLSDETIADVVARTDGVPLFVEEITRAVAEGETTMIPTSLQQSLAARLDRLGDARELAQVAAVVGRDFDGKLLASMVDRDEAAVTGDLHALEDAGLLERTMAASNGVEVYRFRHELVRDVAYESLLRARRRALHAKVATTFSEYMPELVDAQPEVVAHHYSEAGDARSAIDYWTRAAQRASERYALTEAIEHATRAIDGVRELEASEERNQWELGLILTLNRLITQSTGPHDPRNEEIFLRACELTSSKNEDSIEYFTARSGLCSFYIGHARFREALQLATNLFSVAQRAGRRTFLMAAHSWLGDTQYHRGRLDDALHYFEEAFRLYRPERDIPVSALIGFDFGTSALLHIAYLRWYLGERDVAAATMAQAYELGEQLPFQFPLCHVLVGKAMLHALDGEADGAALHAEQAITMANEHEWWLMSGQAAFAKGRSLWLAGDANESVRVLDRAVETLLQPGGFGGSTIGLAWLAEAQLDAGDLERAALTAKRTEDLVERTDERVFEAELLRVNARILAEAGRDAEATDELETALAVARAQNNIALE